MYIIIILIINQNGIYNLIWGIQWIDCQPQLFEDTQ